MQVPGDHAYPGCSLLPRERREPRFLHGSSSARPRAAGRSKQPESLADKTS